MSNDTLFVIIDPTQDQHPALVRAVDIVKQMGGHLHIFCCDYRTDIGAFASKSDAKRQTLQQASAMVNQLIAPLKQQGISVASEVVWNQYWDQSAVHAAARVGADLLITSKVLASVAAKRSEHYLLRNSSCPVLLVKSNQSQALQTVLAAVAIEAGDNEHDALNNRIVSTANRICRATGAELHLVTALVGTLDVAGILDLPLDEDEEIANDTALIEKRFGVSFNRIHAQSGAPDKVIIDTAKRLQAQLAVIGTHGRKGIKGVLIGNTAEKILKQLDIDILVIN